MATKPRLIWLVAFALFFVASPAGWSTEFPAFTAQAFEEAQSAGKLILVAVDASWCSTCSIQKPALAQALAELEKRPEMRGAAVFTVDFDEQRDVVRRFNAQVQSTLIVFRGSTEIGRSVGETDPREIEALLLPRLRHSSPAGGRMLSAGSYIISILAGILSTLSPCVLPLLPIVVASAATAHRFGPLALAGGLALSFAGFGLFLATAGLAVGADTVILRPLAAVLMLLLALVLLSEGLRERFALGMSGISRAAEQLSQRFSSHGLAGQFVIGLLLGAVWSPCIGPTLGAAATLAARGEALGQVALVMMLFGLGAVLPLALIGVISREALARWRGAIGAIGRAGNTSLGVLLAVAGLTILLGVDRVIETRLVAISPDWLTRLTTHF